MSACQTVGINASIILDAIRHLSSSKLYLPGFRTHSFLSSLHHPDLHTHTHSLLLARGNPCVLPPHLRLEAEYIVKDDQRHLSRHWSRMKNLVQEANAFPGSRGSTLPAAFPFGQSSVGNGAKIFHFHFLGKGRRCPLSQISQRALCPFTVTLVA